MNHQKTEGTGDADVEAAIARNEPQELASVVIGVSLYEPDLERAQALCLRLAVHPHCHIRGNALLGFGHLARRFGKLDQTAVQPLIAAGLKDSDPFVRGQAQSAFDDVSHFLKWKAERAPAR